MAAPAFDVSAAHRYFAVELNNQAWDLVEAEHRSDDETELMVHAAHAAHYHWLQVGTLLNRQRALCLLAMACTIARRSEEARRYADQCLAITRQEPEGQTAFDRAMAYGCAARATALYGTPEETRRLHDRAQELALQCDSDDERRAIAEFFPAP